MAEITTVLKNFQDFVNPSSADNKFVAHFYNRFVPEITPELKKMMQKGIPQEVASTDIDGNCAKCKPQIQSWIESMDRNPNPDQYFTMQVSSCEDLSKRTADSLETALKLNERVKRDIDSMNQYKKACDDDLQQQIENARKKNEIIAKKMIQVFGKFEEYLTGVNRHGSMKAEHDTLNEEYQDTMEKITEPRIGLLKKLRDLQTRVRFGVQQTGDTIDSNSMRMRLEAQEGSDAPSLSDELSSEDLKDLFNILKGQKEGLLALHDSVQSNTRVLYTINKEIDNV